MPDGEGPDPLDLFEPLATEARELPPSSVIEPVFEADFLPCSFGFRPKRSAHDALQVLIDQSWKRRRWVLETDIADCFEAIPHSGLMWAIEERVSDRHLLKLLRAMLRAGVMQDGAVHRDATGTPQGGVLSPVLCNVYLHRLDRQWAKRGTGVLVRYADDLVVLCHSKREAEAALVSLRSILAESGLELKQAKTRIVHLREGGEGLDFLGFHHRRVRGGARIPAPAVPRPLALTRGNAKGPRPDP
jgi:group II intron reverse transcriptase/maturase